MIMDRPSERQKQAFTCWKACISEVVFPWQDGKIHHTSILEHDRVRGRTLPTWENIQKLHLKVADCQAVLRCHPFAIMGSLSFLGCGMAGKVSTIDCTNTVLEKGVEFGVVGDVWRDVVTKFRQTDIVGIEWR